MLAQARARLVGAGISPDEAAIDVALYARTILGWDRTRLLTQQALPAPADLEPRLSEWIARREQREPSAYIVGVREFWGLDFAVSPAVLIPRPETELIVEEAIARLGAAQQATIAEVGTGSGCISIAIAHDLPHARITATDISGDALVIARRNAARHQVGERVRFIRTSYLDGVEGPFDAIVANPPYVKDTDRPALSREVGGYEPHVALFGGADGLRDITGVLQAAIEKLSPGGWLIFEFGFGQDDRVEELLKQYSMFRLEALRADLQGIPRTAVLARI